MEYLDLLTPQNCLIIHRDQAYKDEPDLQTEPIYNTQFKMKKLDDAKLLEWENAVQKEDEKLGHPPKNIFVPTKPP